MFSGTIKLALGAAILTMISIAGYASQSRPTPFMAIGGKTSQPIGHYEFCETHRDECNVKSAYEERVRLTAERWNELVGVNNKVNTEIRPATDMELYGRPEFWTYPTTAGDCEDLVLLKRRILQEKGWPTGALLITVVRQQNGDGHAVLTVLTDRGDLILDNLEGHILVWSETEYEYIKRQSEYDTGGWVSIDDGRGNLEVGSLRN